MVKTVDINDEKVLGRYFLKTIIKLVDMFIAYQHPVVSVVNAVYWPSENPSAKIRIFLTNSKDCKYLEQNIIIYFILSNTVQIFVANRIPKWTVKLVSLLEDGVCGAKFYVHK